MLPLLLLLAIPALAHELDVRFTLAPPAVIVRAAYGGTEPVPYAKIQVFSPASATEFQSALTDPRGYFSFVPDAPGAWRVIVDDEEGHRREASIDVPDPFTSAATTPPAPSRLERAALGIALILAATGFWYGVKSRRRHARD